MESFMYAPVGAFAGGDNGDADSLSAPHCKQSIATPTRRGKSGARFARCVDSGCVDMPPLALLLCNDAMDVIETAAGLRGLRPALQVMRDIRVGPAGWSYSDWAGYAYPTPRPKGFQEATYLAQFFDTIEINTSFYQPLQPNHAKQWLERVSANPRFVFTAKLWQKFTHDPGITASAALRISGEDEHAVRAGFDVLRNAGKLGAVLLQFPFAFHRTAETANYL